jgi:energy-coupling factor transporter ATP-binding protein EcfA2
VGAQVSNVSGGQIAVGNRVVQINAEHGSVVVAGDTQPLEVVRRPAPIQRGLRAPRRLVGRKKELDRVHAMLDQGRSVEITGPHGIGKTTLLSALSAMPLPQATPDGVVAPPAGLPVDDVLQFVFDACLERNQRIQPTPEEVRRYLRDLRLFVILDDPDLSGEDVERVIRALPAAVFAVGTPDKRFVAGDVPVTLKGLDTEDAVKLLADALGRELGPDEDEAAARLTTGLAGVPLEILQLAAVVADRGLSLNTVAYEIAPAMDDPRAELQSATVDTLDARERSVLVALAAFGGAAVGIGLLATYAAEPDAGSIVRRLVARGLARGDDVAGWAPEDQSMADEDDRSRAAQAIIGWVGEEGRDPREVALESPAILAVGRLDFDAGRYDSVIRLAAATESALALAGGWGAWKSILATGLAAARAVSDHASEAFFSHQLDVRADMLRPRTSAEEHLAEAVRESDHLYGPAGRSGGSGSTTTLPTAHEEGPPEPGLPKWALPLGAGLTAVAALVGILLLWPGGGASVAIAADELPADGEGRVSVTVSGSEPDSHVEIRFTNAESFRPGGGNCVKQSGSLTCVLDPGLDEQTVVAFVRPQPDSTEVIATASLFDQDAEVDVATQRVGVGSGKPSRRTPEASSEPSTRLPVDASDSPTRLPPTTSPVVSPSMVTPSTSGPTAGPTSEPPVLTPSPVVSRSPVAPAPPTDQVIG